MNKNYRNNYIYKIYKSISSLYTWYKNDYAAPSPAFIKLKVLLRNQYKNSIWIETGTYLGDTARVLARNSLKVYTIEPEPFLYNNAVNILSKYENIKVINKPSEVVLKELLVGLKGNINFWLDGHYSDGITYKGDIENPIYEELKAIESNLNNFDCFAIFIDDIRCFDKRSPYYKNEYPTLDKFVEWADRNLCYWHIEQDIFIIKNK